MRLPILAALVLFFVVGCASKPAEPEHHGLTLKDAVTVPLDLPARGIPVVTLARTTANDEGEVITTIALIDTTAQHPLVSSKYAEKHNLDVHKNGDVRIAEIKSIKIGEATVENFEAVVSDFKSNPGLNEKLDFVLPASLFADALLTIDYTHHRMTIEHGELRAPNGRDILPMKRSDAGEMMIPITMLDQESWMILDTAHTGVGVTFAPSRMDEIKWMTPTVESERVSALLELAPSRIGRMDEDMHIGKYVAIDPIVAVSRTDSRERIGAELLRNFVVTIDQKNNRVRLSRVSTKPIETPPLRRMGFEFADNKGKIEVIPQTGAQLAGLLDDDKIISIDGIPLDRFKYAQRDAVERNKSSMMVRFSRDGHEKITRVELATIVD